MQRLALLNLSPLGVTPDPPRSAVAETRMLCLDCGVQYPVLSHPGADRKVYLKPVSSQR